MLRAATGVRPLQLLDRLPPRPPGPPALAHLEVLVKSDPFESLQARPEFVESLRVMVPLYIHQWRNAPWPQRRARAEWCASVVATHGDQILYRAKGKRGHWSKGTDPKVWIEGSPGTAAAFAALAEGIALLAITAEGGCEVFGMHF